MNCRYFDHIAETCDHEDNRSQPCEGPKCEIRKREEQARITKAEIFEEAKTMAHCVLWLLYLATGNKYAIVKQEGKVKSPFMTI